MRRPKCAGRAVDLGEDAIDRGLRDRGVLNTLFKARMWARSRAARLQKKKEAKG